MSEYVYDMVDRAVPFNRDQGKALVAHGYLRTGVYIGGQAYAVWDPSNVHLLKSLGFRGFLPIYVGRLSAGSLTRQRGRADAVDAMNAMEHFGWHPWHHRPCCLDIEAGDFSSDPGGTQDYANAWSAHLSAEGYRPFLYSTPECIMQLTGHDTGWRGVWVADYVGDKPKLADAPIRNRFPHSRLWQYKNTTTPSWLGVGVDLSVGNAVLVP